MSVTREWISDLSLLVPGVEYDVVLDDCCIAGEFRSTLVRIEDEHGVGYYATWWSNGVHLSNMGQVAVYPIND